MIGSTSSSAGAASANREAYRRAFVTHVHCLLQLGYQRLEPHSLAGAQETAITGKLVKSIKEAMNDPIAPDWVDRYFLADDPPVEDGQRTGRSRLRVDILFECSSKRPRPTMSFEAKRLGKDHTLTTYLGEKGLGAFISGEYAPGEPDVGMLGYVQAGVLDDWLVRIVDSVADSSAALSLCSGSSMEPSQFPDGPANTHRTLHARPAPLDPLSVYHTLLSFCEARV